jgi:hypothetical protein
MKAITIGELTAEITGTEMSVEVEMILDTLKADPEGTSWRIQKDSVEQARQLRQDLSQAIKLADLDGVFAASKPRRPGTVVFIVRRKGVPEAVAKLLKLSES